MEIGHLFGIVLRDMRKKMNISQTELANLAGLDRTYISLLERNLRQPTIDTLFKIAEALGVKASFLIQQVETYNED